jgi:cytochrome c-type biogenesis protein CcmE
MKKIHIIILVSIATAISVLISFMGSLSSYDTIATAKRKPGSFVHLIASLDHSQPVEYDAVKDPNYLTFTVLDSLGASVKVVYRNSKPENLETSERLVLKGAVKDSHFECSEILMKCPSKYKDDIKVAGKNLFSPPVNKAAENHPAVQEY